MHSLPQRAMQRQQGGEAGAGLSPCWCPCSPALLALPSCPSLQLLQNVGFVLICICGAFPKLQQCLRELCLGLHGQGAGKAQELAGMVQILHVEGWELIQGGWEEEDDQREKLGSL